MDSGGSWFEVRGSSCSVNPSSFSFRGIVPVLVVWCFCLLILGCQKKEEIPATFPVSNQKAVASSPAPPEEKKVPESVAKIPTQHSILTKDLNRPIPARVFSKNDRIYLLTVWRGLHGPHEIKVLWVRPDKTVQETVRLKENIPANNPTFTSWAYLSFTKGLLNISPLEGKFVGDWKAQLFLDGNLLKEFDFSVF
jgi:hypothetical protein